MFDYLDKLACHHVIQSFLKSGSISKNLSIGLSIMVQKVIADVATRFEVRSEVMSLALLSSFDLSKLINTLEELYCIYYRSIPSTKIETMMTFLLLICPSLQYQILLILFLLMKYLKRLQLFNTIVKRIQYLQPIFIIFLGITRSNMKKFHFSLHLQ